MNRLIPWRDFMLGGWLVCASSVFGATASERATLPTLTSIQQLYALKPEQAARGYPLRIRGTVLYCDSGWRILFLHDQADADYFTLMSDQREVRAGCLVELEAVTTLKGRGPGAAPVRVRVLGETVLPEPVPLEIGSLLRGNALNRRVAVRGLVERTDLIDNRLRLHLQIDARHGAEVFVREFLQENLADLDDAVVIVKGVNASFQPDESKPRALKLFVPTLDDVVVLERGRGDPFQMPVAKIAELTQRIRAEGFNGPDLRRARVRGRVREHLLGQSLRVEDESGAIIVQSDLRTQTQSGDWLDVAGFPGLNTNGEPVLRHGLFRVVAGDADTTGRDAQTDLPLLGTVQEVRSLGPEEARRCYPVLLRGVVTYYDRAWRVLFVHDETGGIYIDSADQEFLVEPGQRVEVSGVSDPGGYAPMVTRVKLRVLGPGVLPLPKRLSLEHLMTGREDSQWVELEGIVRSFEQRAGHIIMQLKTSAGPFQVTVPEWPPRGMADRLVDSKLRLRGACGVLANVYQQLVGIHLHVPNWKEIEFLRAGPADPFALPAIPIRDLLRFTPKDIFEHRVRIQGVVTLVRKDGSIYVQEDQAGTRIQTVLTNELRMGDWIEAVGFPVLGGYTPALEHVQFRRVGPKPLPPAIETTAKALLQGTNDAQRVEMKARLIESVAGPNAMELALEEDGIIFNAVVESPREASRLAAFRAGSVLKVRGVCQLQIDEWRSVRSFRLLVPSGADIQVLRSPPWWSLQRMLAFAGAMGGVVVLALGWVVSLRRTVRKQTEVIRRQLDQETALEREYRDLFENASDIIYTVDLNGVCTSLNRAAEKTFGYRLSEGEAVAHASFYQPESFARLDKALCALKAGSPFPSLELEAVTKDGQARILELRARFIERERAPVGYQCIARDITERRHLESQLQQARKLESVGQLAAGIAHDFNNILTIIQGNASLLTSESLSEAERSDMASAILHASERGASLTHQLVLFSRKRRLQLRWVNLNEVAREMMKMLDRILGEDIKLELSCASDLPPVRGDRSMIEQVILNLAVNARDAMRQGGTLRIATAQIEISAEQAKQNPEAKAGPAVLLEVTDTGCGIPPEILPRIFEPFFTTKDIGRGTGLGLSTVYGIVKQHSGWIEVTSQPGRGTSFRIFFPPSFDAAPPETSPRELAPVPAGRECILLVEDEEPVRVLLRDLLSRSGYTVFAASNGVEAQQIWREHKGAIDLLLTDIVMPGGISGVELAESLRREAPDLKVVFTSGYSQELASGRFHFERTIRYLPKPYMPQALLATLRECLDQKPAKPADAAAK